MTRGCRLSRKRSSQRLPSLRFQIRCGSFRVGLCKNGGNNCNADNASTGKLQNIIPGNAADGDDRNRDGMTDVPERISADLAGVVLRACGEYGTDAR